MSNNSSASPVGNGGAGVPDETVNPFDPKRLRLNMVPIDTLRSKEIIVRALVGRPSSQMYFRVHPLPEYQLDTAIIKWDDDRQVYLIAPECRRFLINDSKRVRLYYYITDTGAIGLWDVGLPAEFGKSCLWWDTAHAAAREAMTKWIRISTDNRANMYKTFEHTAMKDEPAWPDLTMTQILELAFTGRIILDADHPIIKRLMGMS
jgi:hypothetical protein